jgi:hypothetical protein
MTINSKVRVAQLMGVPDSSVQVLRVVTQPYIKQFSVLSRRSTTKIKPNLYTVRIGLDTPKITPQSKVACSCTCADFRYRLSYTIHDKDAQLAPEDYLLK